MLNKVSVFILVTVIAACTPSVDTSIERPDLEDEIQALKAELKKAKEIQELSNQVVSICNNKVVELDKYSEELKSAYEKEIELQNRQIEAQDKYIDKLESFAKDNDPDGFWNRNKGLFGFIGGVMFTGAAVYGAGQLRP